MHITRFGRASAALAVMSVGVAAPSALALNNTVPDNGNGTADLPPQGLEYIIPDSFSPILIDGGLPAGTTMELDAVLKDFTNTSEVAGGNLGGDIQTYDALLEMDLTGAGDLAGFNRTLFMQVAVETHSAPRTPFDAVQSFDTEMVALQGEILGDPDFDSFGIKMGIVHGLPGPGHTTLTDLGSEFRVDSFFDVVYEIEFVGAPGSVLEGLGGSNQGETRLAIPAPSAAACLAMAGLAGALRRRRG